MPLLRIFRNFLFKTGLISIVKKILYKENSFFFKFMSNDIKTNSILYKFKTKVEIANYAENIDIHDNPPIHDYWFNKFILPKLNKYNYNSINDFYVKNLIKVYKKNKHKINILSIGSGNCDLEFSLADALFKKKFLNLILNVLISTKICLIGRRLKLKIKHIQINFSLKILILII